MKYSFRQLEVFLAVSHTENITRAAQSLSMSQSAASSALKDLEGQFSIQLFDRVGKRLQLNELGRLLRPSAQALLEQAQALEHAFSQHLTPGLLKVGATLTIGNYLAVGIMSRYMNEHAGGRVTLDVANTSRVVKQVLNFDLDIGLIEGELHHPDLDIIPWREDRLVVFCAPEHYLAEIGHLDDTRLRQTPWILREQGSGTRQTFERAMHGLMPELDVRLELQHTEAIKRAVEAGLGIGCLSMVALREAFRRGTLVPLAVPQRDFRRHFYFILHRHKYRSAGIQRWIELCKEQPVASV